MTGLVGAAIILGTLFFILQVSYNQSRGRREKLNRLMEAKDALEAKVSALYQEKEMVKKSIAGLELQLSVFEATTVPGDGLDSHEQPPDASAEFPEGDDLLKKAKPRPSGRRAVENVIDVLVQQKVITEEQLAKAKKYRQETGSNIPLEEIIVMFEYCSAGQLKTATHFFNSLKGKEALRKEKEGRGK